MIKVGLLSLGCAKNLVDSEIMIGHLRQAAMELTSDAAEADVLIVNTCSFIDSAKEESIEAIFDAHQKRGMSRKRKEQKLIVAGCMSQRFASELTGQMPEVDAFVGLDQITEIVPIVQKVLSKNTEGDLKENSGGNGGAINYVTPHPTYIPDYNTPRFRLTPSHYAYLKIAEGCNHPCSFCVIPQMRGKHRSRTIDSVLREARSLVEEGVRELILISQDTTYFGMDRWEEKAGPRQPVDASRGDSLIQLLEELDSMDGEFWIRLLYTHPAHWSDELIRTIGQSKKIARYIDIPLQHIHPEMLEQMKRQTSSEYIVDLLARMRAGIENLTLRTTFIVGFPGETEEHFEYLLNFIESTRFERLGVFQYSQEEGSRAAKMENQIDPATRKKRWSRAMKLQQKLAREMADAQIGKTVRVLTEGGRYARSQADAPEVDGRVILKEDHTAGQFMDITIGSHNVYDLIELA